MPEAQLALDPNARFGRPRIERYRINDELRLSVQYGGNALVSAIRIAPNNYRYHSAAPPKVPSRVANKLLEHLLPGITTVQTASETVVRSTWPGFVRQSRCKDDVSLVRDYRLTGGRKTMFAASLAVGTFDIRKNVSKVIASLGAPDYRQFSSGDGLGIGFDYGSDGSIRQIFIGAEEPLLADREYATPINRDVAERLLEELLPPSIQNEKAGKSMFRSGMFMRRRTLYEQVVVSRDYVGDDMVTIHIAWPIGPASACDTRRGPESSGEEAQREP